MVRRWVVPVGIAIALASVGVAGNATASTGRHGTQAARQFVAHSLPAWAPGSPNRPEPGTHPAIVDGHPVQFSKNWSGQGNGSTLCDTISRLTSEQDFTATWDNICHGHST
jgi:hypothetical protein